VFNRILSVYPLPRIELFVVSEHGKALRGVVPEAALYLLCFSYVISQELTYYRRKGGEYFPGAYVDGYEGVFFMDMALKEPLRRGVKSPYSGVNAF